MLRELAFPDPDSNPNTRELADRLVKFTRRLCTDAGPSGHLTEFGDAGGSTASRFFPPRAAGRRIRRFVPARQ
jgi:hypothetical protein